jgi:hypothetical protein
VPTGLRLPKEPEKVIIVRMKRESNRANAFIDSIRRDRHEVIEQPEVLETLSGHFNPEEKEYEGCSCILDLLENMSAKDKEVLTQLMSSESLPQPKERKTGSVYTQAHRAKKRLLKKLISCCGSDRFRDYMNCDCEGAQSRMTRVSHFFIALVG